MGCRPRGARPAAASAAALRMRDPGEAAREKVGGEWARVPWPAPRFPAAEAVFPLVYSGTGDSGHLGQGPACVNETFESEFGHKSVGLWIVSAYPSGVFNPCVILTGRSSDLKHDSRLFLRCKYVRVNVGVSNELTEYLRKDWERSCKLPA